MSEFRMPSLGADMEFGKVVEWRIKPGDMVKRGDIVALVETEKGVIEVEIFESGVVESILAEPGRKIPVGAPLALLRSDGKVAGPPPEKAAPVSPVLKEAAVSPPGPFALPADRMGRQRVSPLARKRAEVLGIDLTAVEGTGEDGSVTAVDVERFAERVKTARAPAATETRGLDLNAMRRVIAAAMARSKREIPHYYLSTIIDMRRSLDWLAEANAERPVARRLLYSALLLRAGALALRKTPELNGFWIDGSFKPAERIHIGVAVSLRGGGLINPALHDVDKKSLDEVMEGLLDLVNRARTGHLRASELSDGTITVTNLGEQGVESVFGVIYPPQVAIVGFGKITERPCAKDGDLGVHPMIDATLAADHRVSDGHRGGRFLTAVNRLLQEPEKL